MRNLKVLAAGTVVGLGSIAATPAMAEVEGSFGVATEYVFRGVSSGNPQVWGGLDWSSASGLYAGTWVSSTGFGNGSSSAAVGNEEVDFYAGYSVETGGVGLDFGAIYYAFPSQPSQGGAGITEIYTGLTAGGFSGYLWFAPAGIDGPDDDEYLYVDLNYDLPISETTSLGLHVGALEPLGDAAGNRSDGTDETDFDFGVSLNVGDFFLATTYLEGDGGGYNTIAGYSWSISDVFK